MSIVVCIKQINGPEIPAGQFKLDHAAKHQVREGLSLVVSACEQKASVLPALTATVKAPART